jgi:hypothetical protein
MVQDKGSGNVCMYCNQDMLGQSRHAVITRRWLTQRSFGSFADAWHVMAYLIVRGDSERSHRLQLP